MPTISPPSLVRNGAVDDVPPSIEELRGAAARAFDVAVRFVEERSGAGELSFRDLERELRGAVFAVGRALIVLFLALREQHVIARRAAGVVGRFDWFGRTFRSAPPIARNLTTMFGVVRYFRTYMREVAEHDRHGFHPLDFSLGLTADRFSWNVLVQAARLATELSYATARAVLSEFVPNAPSTEVIEQTMLGLGAHAEAWFELQPAPEDDGEVLVMEIDGKAVPTATERELLRRRRKRTRRPKSGSARHRGRDKRARHPKQPRRKKGDKAKNGKMVTMLVMYTLRRRGTRRLEGPVNRRHYASFGPKRHAFAIARREANKRGFTSGSGRLVQLLTDGDNDYADLAVEYFPEALHTVDCYHVFEKLWEAGACFLREGSAELAVWVAEQKDRLFNDDVESVLVEMERRRDAIAPTGPGNKGRRERLHDARRYLQKRTNKIRYGQLRRRDLVISTGIVEGAVKHIVGRRCDHGGMRWIKERAQVVVQLRCIQINGDWELFENFVHDRLRLAAQLNRSAERLQNAIPQQLPEAA
jgi:hypothetical protein